MPVQRLQRPARSPYTQLHMQQTEALTNPPHYFDDIYAGRGVVMCVGGPKYFIPGYANIKLLREKGCTLPVEVWHLGSCEMDEKMKGLLHELGDVSVIDAFDFYERGKFPRQFMDDPQRLAESDGWTAEAIDAYMAKVYSPRILNGWELNPYSILHSRFQEVLFLDADNSVTSDPTYLFESPAYQQYGALFWPDYQNLDASRSIWQIMHVQYRDEPEFESGQIVVDKKRCWKELWLTMHLNAHSDFYYKHIHGDKETYHMAWRKAGTEYGMCPHAIHKLPQNGKPGIHGSLVMCQHDWNGNVLFQHRNLAKFTLPAQQNKAIPGFQDEPHILKILESLEKRWPHRGVMAPAHDEHPAIAAIAKDVPRLYAYQRTGLNERARSLELRSDNRVGTGAAKCERFWRLKMIGSEPMLCLEGDSGRTGMARREADGSWRGEWWFHERCPFTLTPKG